MRTLSLNPTDHEIHISAEPKNEEGFSEVTIFLNALDQSTGMVTAVEADKISKWFADLAKELKKKK